MTQQPPFEDLPPPTRPATPSEWLERVPPLEPRPVPGTRRGLYIAVGILVGIAFVASISLAFVAGAGAERLGLLGDGVAAEWSGTTGDELTLVDEAWGLLHTEYVGRADLDSRAMAYAAIEAMTEAVGDTGHTMFLTPEEYAESRSSLSGSYAGIGAELNVEADEPVVVGVFRGAPADVAGIVPGDVIVAVDGIVTKGQPLDAVVAKVRGPEGTSVTLRIRRAGAAELLTFRIVRATVEIPTVEGAAIPGTSLAMVRVEQFSDGAGVALKRELAALLAASPTGLVLDLRGNPGGYVTEAVAVASEFLASGVVYEQRDADGNVETSEVTPGGTATEIPLVVLVDSGTASAAEIVTGALQDPGRARVVGVRTFGTGTVLGTFELPDGSAMRIGTVEWVTPKGRVIWHEGLSPDVTVTLATGIRPIVPGDLARMSADDVRASKDSQLLKAIELLTATR